jgi:hypothetical protein
MFTSDLAGDRVQKYTFKQKKIPKIIGVVQFLTFGEPVLLAIFLYSHFL